MGGHDGEQTGRIMGGRRACVSSSSNKNAKQRDTDGLWNLENGERERGLSEIEGREEEERRRG